MESQSTPLLPLLSNVMETKVRPKRERPVTFPSTFTDENLSPIDYTAPGPKVICSVKDLKETTWKRDLKKSHYYEEAFSPRGSPNCFQGRLFQNSMVVAELKTNCKIQDEERMLVADLIFRLAQIYQRSETCIMLTVQQDTGVFFGNTTELSYLLKIYALSSFIAPVTNLRNTNLIQTAMHDLLHIPMNQGIIVFIPVPEENLATNGLTAGSEISRLIQNDQDESPNIFKTISRTMSRRLKSSSDQTAPISLPSTVGTSTASPSMQTEIHHSPIVVDDTLMSPEEKRRGIRKRISLRGLVPRRFMEKTSSRDKDGQDRTKEVAKGDDSNGDECKEGKAKSQAVEKTLES
ncbi:hypothetical protein N7466_001341 [Penicillium verhagenii]|uniref:uncharacterized protein n=1 Tax=Penicillium verhagenii TaxID=1562060 RepID=UPI002544DB14|nr:uncharacterized protein N7466_001341 [Penicillium verhagenii]KAJ5948326.1 hypothetical protein N7466_001341 [Penicillium verhagenii]